MKKTLSKVEAARLTALINFLELQPEAYEFSKPVDFKALGLDDYPQIIKQPMDLSTAKKKLKGSKYQTVQEVVADLQLIWDNCKAYNVFESVSSRQPITKQAEAMEKHMDAYVTQHLAPSKPVKRTREDSPEAKTYDLVTYTDQIELSEKVRRVSHETLARIVQLVQAECPTACEELDTSRLQVRVEKLNLSVFNKINQ